MVSRPMTGTAGGTLPRRSGAGRRYRVADPYRHRHAIHPTRAARAPPSGTLGPPTPGPPAAGPLTAGPLTAGPLTAGPLTADRLTEPVDLGEQDVDGRAAELVVRDRDRGEP